MFTRHTSVRRALATTLVSTLFVSLSAHAGLLGVGGTAATGIAGSVIGNAGPANVYAAGMAASQAATQARVQSTLPQPRVPAPPAITPPSAAFGAAGAARADISGAVAGEVRGTQAAVVSTGDSATHRTRQVFNRARTSGEFAMDQAIETEASTVPRKASVSAEGSASGTVQASGRNGSVNGSTSATVNGSVSH